MFYKVICPSSLRNIREMFCFVLSRDVVDGSVIPKLEGKMKLKAGWNLTTVNRAEDMVE